MRYYFAHKRTNPRTGEVYVDSVTTAKEVYSDRPGWRRFVSHLPFFRVQWHFYTREGDELDFIVTDESADLWNSLAGRDGLGVPGRDTVLVRTALPPELPELVCKNCGGNENTCMCDESECLLS